MNARPMSAFLIGISSILANCFTEGLRHIITTRLIGFGGYISASTEVVIAVLLAQLIGVAMVMRLATLVDRHWGEIFA